MNPNLKLSHRWPRPLGRALFSAALLAAAALAGTQAAGAEPASPQPVPVRAGTVSPAAASTGTDSIVIRPYLLTPDLTVTSAYFEKQGEHAELTFSIKNTGTAKAGAFWVLATAGVPIGLGPDSFLVSGLAVGESQTYSITAGTLGCLFTIKGTVVADADDTIAESNETNNTLTNSYDPC